MKDIDWNAITSPKAWMSIRDADLIEHILEQSAHISSAPLRILEWGSGLSTLSFTNFLRTHEQPFHWVTLEHNRDFFEEQVAPQLLAYEDVHIRFLPEDRAAQSHEGSGRYKIDAAVFNYGTVRPDLPHHEADRGVNMDAYVQYPATLQQKFDVIIVDGRKRRRCLLQAAQLLAPQGVALLHDAQRAHYHAAFSAFESQRQFGDELWIGATGVTDFSDRIPSHGFLPSPLPEWILGKGQAI